MASVSDNVILAKSKESPYDTLFEKNEWVVVNDTQVEYGSNTSVLETAPLANNGKFVMYNKAYLSVPLLVTVTGETLVDSDFRVAIKQSFLSLVNSITVDLNGKSVVQQNNLIDIVNNFQVLTSESLTTTPRWSTIGFGGSAGSNSFTLREGYLTSGDYQAGGDQQDYSVLDATTLGTLQQSHTSRNVEGVYQLSVRAIIYLKDLHPLFNALPVSKSLNFKMQVFWNASTSTIDATGAFTRSLRAYNGTNPLEMTVTVPKAMEASIYIGDRCLSPVHKDNALVSSGRVGNQVQLFVPVVQMKPEIEQDYLSTNRVKEVRYNDYYTYSIKALDAGDNFNKLLSNGISDLKGVLLVPFNVGTEKENESPLKDGLPKPFGHFNNLQVLVGGLNVMSSDLRYTHQTFTQEVMNSYGINSNESPSLGSGVIGFSEWFRRPYYYVDCSRCPDAISDQYRSLQVSGTNCTNQTMDIVVFAIYERKFSLAVDNGEIS